MKICLYMKKSYTRLRKKRNIYMWMVTVGGAIIGKLCIFLSELKFNIICGCIKNCRSYTVLYIKYFPLPYMSAKC